MHLQNSREILALADSSGFAVFSPLQAAAGELLLRHLHLQFNQAAGEYCGVKLSGNVSVGPLGSGSCDLCFAPPATSHLVCVLVSSPFMQDMDVPGQGAGLTKGADFIAADSS